MKKTLLSCALIACASYASSQTILLEQDFQGFANGGTIDFIEEPDDAEVGDWISFDQDNLADGSGADPARPGAWYGSLDLGYFASTEIGADTNFVMASSSWMDGFAPGNRNWLISPEIEITNGNTLLEWSSGVFQTPRYADGYTVRISPNASLDDLDSDFSDIVFTQAQMVEAAGWVGDFYPGIDYAGCAAPTVPEETNVCWFPETYGDGTGGTGYRHAEDHTNSLYIGTDPDDAAPQAYRGFLEPHSADLSAYAGQTIRIAWVHDSDDDNLTMVDDISVQLVDNLEELSFDQLIQLFPNPANESVNLTFSSMVQERADVSIIDAQGRLVHSQSFMGTELTAAQSIDIQDLSTGLYSIQIILDSEGLVSSSFLKK